MTTDKITYEQTQIWTSGWDANISLEDYEKKLKWSWVGMVLLCWSLALLIFWPMSALSLSIPFLTVTSIFLVLKGILYAISELYEGIDLELKSYLLNKRMEYDFNINPNITIEEIWEKYDKNSFKKKANFTRYGICWPKTFKYHKLLTRIYGIAILFVIFI